MTVAELSRYEEGAMWRLRTKAQFDYALADLIGVSSARMMSSDVTYPPIDEVYPSLFESMAQERKEEEIATQNSVNRFMEFAMRHNSMMRKEEGD